MKNNKMMWTKVTDTMLRIVWVCMVMVFVACGQMHRKELPFVAQHATERTDTISADSGVVDGKCRLTIYEKKDRKVYLERDSSWLTSCFAEVNGVVEKLKFGNEYLDDGAAELTAFSYDKYLYVVGDIRPNSNGWTTRFFLYRIDTDNFSVKCIDAGAAIFFGRDGIRMAKARLTNPEADCTADEIWVMHDEYYHINGNFARKDKREYDYEEMERRYGERLINSQGIVEE